MPLQNFLTFCLMVVYPKTKLIWSSVFFKAYSECYRLAVGLLILTSKTNGSPRLRMRLAASMPISSRPRILGWVWLIMTVQFSLSTEKKQLIDWNPDPDNTVGCTTRGRFRSSARNVSSSSLLPILYILLRGRTLTIAAEDSSRSSFPSLRGLTSPNNTFPCLVE